VSRAVAAVAAGPARDAVRSGVAPAAGSVPGFLPPLVQETAAATRLAPMAKSNVACRPARNGAVISRGKKLWPVRVACWAADR
jgi:hypothetical protein